MQSTATPLPSGQQTQPKVTLSLSIDELNIIMMGLIKLPYENSAPVVDIVRSQASSQLQQQQSQTSNGPPPSGTQTVNLQ